MTLHPIESGNFKLDGGAMFGVVPKSLWTRTNPADANNMIDMAARCLLIEDGDRLILIDTGMGDKQSEKFFGYYYMWGDHSLDASLAKAGFHRDDITDVFLTHLHFDHCGGCIINNPNGNGYLPAFKNAKFWTNENHWNWAVNPNAREKASFLKENILPMQDSGQLNFIKKTTKDSFQTSSELDFGIFFADGHTEKQMIPRIDYKEKTLVFAADLLPSSGHIPLSYVMGYDTKPLVTLTEKEKFLNEAAEREYIIFLQHDNYSECCSLQKTEKGVRLQDTFSLSEIL